jgi:hypothetical protein
LLLLSACGSGDTPFGSRQPRLDSMVVVDSVLRIPALGVGAYSFMVTDKMKDSRLTGWFNASGSISSEVNVFVATADGYASWKADKGCNPPPLFSTGWTTSRSLDVPIDKSGTYYLVYDNLSSLFSRSIGARAVLKYYVGR